MTSSDQASSISTIKTIMYIAMFFAAVILTILMLNYVQIVTSEPVDSPALEQLRTQLSMDENNAALRAQIRELDLMIRKAYFIKQHQLKIGGYLFAISIIVFCLCGNIIYFKHKRFVDLSHVADLPDIDKESFLNYTLSACGVIIFSGIGFFFMQQGEAVIADQQPTVQKTTETNQAEEIVPYTSYEDLKKNWTAFRGVDSTGVATRAKVPASWDEAAGKNILWKVKTPRQGYSSPIVWGDKVFITAADKKARSLYCYNSTDGTLLWEHKTDNIPNTPKKLPVVAEDTGFAAATPVTDGKYVFAIFATGDLFCTDMDGKRIWARNMGACKNAYGYSTSPLVYENKLIIQYDNDDDRFVMALDTKTGKPIWKTAREVETSWSSPLIVREESKSILILNALPKVMAYDLNTGVKLWENECMGGEVAASPTHEDGVVFVANEGASLFAIDIKTGKTLWENEDVMQPDASSPLAFEGYIYIATDAAVISCVDAKSGEMVWEHETEQGFYSSPVAVNGLIYAYDKKGITHIIKPGKEYNEVATAKLKQSGVATPAFANDSIYIRSFTSLYRIGEKK